MNRLLLCITLLLAACAADAQDAKTLFMKYCNMKGVEAAYISQEMFESIGRLPKIEIMDKDVDLSSVIRELKHLYMLESDRPRISGKIRDDVYALVKQKGYKLMMRDRDSDETNEIYALYSGDRITSFLFISTEDLDEVEFICLEGDILKEDLRLIMQHAGKNNQ